MLTRDVWQGCLVARRQKIAFVGVAAADPSTVINATGTAKADCATAGRPLQSCLVARRAEDRLQLVHPAASERPDLQHERGRERAAEADPPFGAQLGSCLVARREDRVLSQHGRPEFEIYLMNADGSGLRNLTREWGLDGWPVWSPDGQKIAFTKRTATGGLRLTPTQRSAEARATPLVLLVARRAEDRLRTRPRRQRQQRRHLRHQRQRERGAKADRGRGASPLVARRTEDRLPKQAQRQRRHLRHEPRRQQPAEPDPEPGEGRRLAGLVARAEIGRD